MRMRDASEGDHGGHASGGAWGGIGIAWTGERVWASIGASSRRAARAETGHRGTAAASRGRSAIEGASFAGEHAGDGAQRQRATDSGPGCQEFGGHGQWSHAKDHTL